MINKYIIYFIIFLISILNIGYIFNIFGGNIIYANFSNNSHFITFENIDENIKNIFNINDSKFHIYFGDNGNFYLSGVNKIFIDKNRVPSIKENFINEEIVHEVIHYKLYNLDKFKHYFILIKLKENEKLINELINEELKKDSNIFENKLLTKLFEIDSQLKNYSLDNRLKKISLTNENLYKDRIIEGLNKNNLTLVLTNNYSSLDEYITYFFEDSFDLNSKTFKINKKYFGNKYHDPRIQKILYNYEYISLVLNNSIK